MANVSSLGIGSGLDVNSIISQLMAIERKPVQNLQAAATKIQTQISEVGKVTSALSKLRELSTTLSSSTFWQKTSASSASSAVAVTTTSSAAPASYKVEVQQLASAQAILADKKFAAVTDPVGSGTFHIELGSWSADGNPPFTQRTPPATVEIIVEATDTVQTLRDKINSSGGGVTASLVTDVTGVRLMISSQSSGAENAFRVTVDAGATGDLSSLNYDPEANPTDGTRRKATAANSLATINDVQVSSSSNTLTNVLDGLSLTLKATTFEPTSVTVSTDSEAIKTTLKEFASAYSSLVALIATDTKYDAATKKAGPLQGDTAVTNLQMQMRKMLGASSTASTAFAFLSDAGFEQQRDGSLTVNETRLDNAMTNLPQLRLLFANTAGTGTGEDGFARKLRSMADSLLNVDGALTSRKDALSQKLQRNGKSIESLEDRLANTQKRLERQYGALDTKLSSINALSSYVSQQISQWNKST